MRTTLKFIATILLTFALAFATSLLLETDIVNAHWSRQFLVIFLMLIQLVFGGLIVRQLALGIKTK